MNAAFKRNSKNKTKSTQKVVTVKEMFSKKEPSTSKTLSSEQNESLIEVFKSYGVKAKKPLSSQSTSSQGISQSKSDDPLDELFSDFKAKVEKVSDEDASTKSDDSFDELFSDFKCNTVRSVDKSKPKVTIGEDKNVTEILRENLSQCCPICFRKNNFDDTGLYINHLKSCAYKNKIPTEQLKKALELQQKQITERLALGLPTAPKEKTNKKPYQRKGPMDSNLELGIALSTSLRESEIMNKIQEKETLIEAGIEPETLSQYRGLQLEDYGFETNKSVETTNFKGSKRYKIPRSTVLFSRTQEERERIITEKVAVILIDCDTQNCAPDAQDVFVTCNVKSKYLKRYKDDNLTLWKKSYEVEDHPNDSYYVDSLSNFISPCKVAVGSKLKNLSQIPCRSLSPGKPPTSKSMDISLPPLQKTPLVQKLEKKFVQKSTQSIDSRFCQDWRYMLNKDMLSDLTIYAKNEVPIFAHKLVFYVRCRAILPETIEETENGKRKEMLMWMEYSYEAIMTVLEYIYTGMLPSLVSLSESDKNELRALSDRYGFKDVIDALDNVEEPQPFKTDEPKSPIRQKIPSNSVLLPVYHKAPAYGGDEVELFSSDEDNPPIEPTGDGGENLQMMLDAIKTQNLRSPCMFDEDPEPMNTSQILDKSQVEEILWKLCSPVHSPKAAEDEGDRSPLTQCIDLTQEWNSDKKNIEKRKSFSPLEKSKLKKSRTLDNSSTSTKSPGKRVPLSQLLNMSDTIDDESLNKTNAHDALKFDNTNSSFCITNNTETIDVCETKELEPNLNQPYISPVWDGFEDHNMEYSPFSNPIPPDTPGRKFPLKKNPGDSLFDSFSVDEDQLNKIEANAITFATQKPIQSSTPDCVRKFQRRSKSENCLTPVNKANLNVTPLADYSNMKGDDLKKELEKYGIKPGLSRNKAKMMLRHIYEQLHPYEDEIKTSNRTKDESESVSNRNTDSNGSSASDTSGISLLEETYVDDAEICSQDVTNTKSKVSVDTAFRNVLREDKSLHEKILLYEPVWLESLKATLKDYGARCSMNELMNYLDEKCITFRSQQQRGKQRGKPKKKSKSERASKRKIEEEI